MKLTDSPMTAAELDKLCADTIEEINGDILGHDERVAIQQLEAERQAAIAKHYRDSGAWNLFDGLNDPLQRQGNPWLFDGLLARAGGGVLVLDSGQGKTWLQEEIGICTAVNLPLFGHCCRL